MKSKFILLFSLFFVVLSFSTNAQCDPCPGDDIVSLGNGVFTTNALASFYEWEICDGDATIISGQGTPTVTVSCGANVSTLKLYRYTRKGCVHSCIEICNTVIGDCDCGYGLNNNCISLSQEGTPQDCETVFAWMDHNCLPDCWDYILWSAAGPVTFPPPNTQVEGDLNMTWDLEPFGSDNHWVVVTAEVVLITGESCIVQNAILLDCSGGPGGGGGENLQIDNTSNNAEAAVQVSWKPYPNPIQTGQLLTIPYDQLDRAESAEILNINGQTMHQIDLSQNKLTIGSDWMPGVYFIKVVRNGVPTVTKFVIY